MKYALIFLGVITGITGSRLKAQPVSFIGMDVKMKILSKWGDPARFPDGDMKAGDYARIDLSPVLSKKEIKAFGKSDLPTITLYYEGGMKNNLCHGLGKLQLRNRNSGFQDWTYTGEFVNGKAEGFGELNCNFYSSKTASGEKVWFRGEFKNGQPTEGCLIHLFHHEKKKMPVLYYSGQVFFEYGKIGWHGYGALSFTEMRHTNPKYQTETAIPGAMYIGQFYRHSATGFALTNTVDSTGKLGPLVSILAGADDIFQQYSNLGLHADFVAGMPYTPPVSKQAQLYRLYPKLDSASYQEMALANGIIYKGMMLNNLPYGLGYVEYAGENGNYRDIGWWMNGKKLKVEQVLKNFLPDSNWLQPKTIPVFVKDCFANWNDKLKKTETVCVDKQTEGIYYGPISENGFPRGWGVLHPAQLGEKGFKSYLGKFTGADPVADKSTNMGAELLYVYSYNQQQKLNVYDPVKAAQDQFYGEFEYGVFDQYFPRVQQVSFKRHFPRIAMAEDMFIEKRYVDYIRYEREYSKMLSGRPTMQVQAVYLKKGSPDGSYVLDKSGNKISMITVTRDELKRGDYVLLGKAFYYVHDSYRNIMLGLVPTDGFWFADAVPANVLVVRGYTISNIEHKLAYCSGCSNLPSLPTGPVTVTGSAHSGRYQTNVYQNNSGGGTVVSTPIYNEISITLPPPTRKPCKVCNDRRKNEKVPIEVIEL